MSSGKARFVRNEFNKIWSGELDRKIKLVCSDEEAEYLTWPQDALNIQIEIAKHTDRVEVILDAFAGVGGDSVAAMHIHRNADIWAVQRARTPMEKERFANLGENLKQFRRALKRNGTVNWHPSDIGSFIREFRSDISLLYLDPPWMLDSDSGKISSAVDIRDFLKKNVFDFLRRKSCPRLICFKLPHKVDDVEEWPDLASPYRNVGYLFPRRKYHVHILHVIE